MPEITMNAHLLRVRSTKPGGFWRCGRHFGPHWEEIPAGTITLDALTILKAEPMLVVEEIAVPGEVREVAVVVMAPPAADTPEVEPAEDESGRRKRGK